MQWRCLIAAYNISQQTNLSPVSLISSASFWGTILDVSQPLHTVRPSPGRGCMLTAFEHCNGLHHQASPHSTSSFHSKWDLRQHLPARGASPLVKAPQEERIVHGGPGTPDGGEHPAEADHLAGVVALQHHGRHLAHHAGHRPQQGRPLQAGQSITLHQRECF